MSLSYFLDNLIIVIQCLYEIIDSNIVFRLSFVMGLFTVACYIFGAITDVIGYK